jgi:hypothetical protein
MTTNKTPVYLSVLMAGLLAAGAHAQSTSASGSSDLPPKAGEASTQTMGAPNAQTTNSTASETPAMLSKDAVRQDAQGRSAAAATTSVPGKAGEASTMVQGKPNAAKQVAGKSREEVRAELLNSRKDYQDNLRAKRNPDQRLGVMGASGSGTSATVGAATSGTTGATAGGASGDATMGAGATSGAAAAGSTGGGGAGTSSGTATK